MVANREPSVTHGGMMRRSSSSFALGAEHRPQDRVERDAHHRFERLERSPLGPGGRFAQRLLLEDLLVVLDALAVEGRGEQLAATTVLGAVEREHRARAQDPAQVGLDVPDVLGGAMKSCLASCGSATITVRPEHRNVQGEGGAIPPGQPRDELAAGEGEGNALQRHRSGQCGRQTHRAGLGAGTSATVASLMALQPVVVLRCTADLWGTVPPGTT